MDWEYVPACPSSRSLLTSHNSGHLYASSSLRHLFYNMLEAYILDARCLVLRESLFLHRIETVLT